MKACKYSLRHGGGATKVLWLYGLRSMHSLEALVDALVPAGDPLASLSMWSSNVDAAALEGCPRLAGLTALQLGSCSCSWATGSLGAAEALLRQAPALTELSIGKCKLEAPPACLGRHRALRKLSLQQNHLAQVPAAPYLAGG